MKSDPKPEPKPEPQVTFHRGYYLIHTDRVDADIRRKLGLKAK